MEEDRGGDYSDMTAQEKIKAIELAYVRFDNEEIDDVELVDIIREIIQDHCN